jgi:N-acetylmuramoyl-L-alanine amidase
MPGFLGLVLQLAATAQPGDPPPLTVRLGERVRAVPAVTLPQGGAALQADALAQALGGRVVAPQGRADRFRLEVGPAVVEFEAGSALAVTATDTVPLAAEVLRRGGVTYVPFSVATDLLPRLGAGVLYDAERTELRRFAPVGASRTVAAPAKRSDSGSAALPPAPPARTDNSRVAEARLAGDRKHVVVVDAGHGGPDRGMVGPLGAGPKVFEKDITLAVSKALRVALEERGIGVVMTRTTDTLIALSDRGKIANQAKGDLFVSIHVNAANPRWTNPGGARGFETYFLAEAKTEDARRVEAMENESIRFETTVDASRDDPLGFIIRDMAQNEHLRESSRLAELIQGGMRQVHPGPSRGVKQAGFRVLVTAFMPAVLVEIGFGTNRAEAAYMNDPARQAQLASQLADAIVRYLAEYERKVGG